jgi:caffeoyl-CoA O-methyltransferase
MDKSYRQGDPRIADYVEQVFEPEDEVLREIRARSHAAGLPDIQVGPMDGLLLEVLTRGVAARKVVEIGTLGGYSGVCLLRGMHADGVLHSFELEEHNAEVARKSFRKAGFAGRAHVHVGKAQERLADIEKDGPFDVVFIDADKESYPAYLDWAAKHLRVGGMVLGDNAYLFGELVEPPKEGRAVPWKAMKEFHRKLASGEVFRSTIIPTGEGLAVGVRIR